MPGCWKEGYWNAPVVAKVGADVLNVHSARRTDALIVEPGTRVELMRPRGPQGHTVRERDRVYEIDGAESRILGAVGAFRVVSEGDLQDLRDEAGSPRRSVRHLEEEGLVPCTSSGSTTQGTRSGTPGPRPRPTRSNAATARSNASSCHGSTSTCLPWLRWLDRQAGSEERLRLVALMI